MPPTKTPRPILRKIAKVSLALAIGIFVAVLVAELGLRYLIHHPEVSLGAFGRSLRNPENFADGNSDDDYWRIQYLALPPDQAGPGENPDPITGWTGHYVKPGLYEHVDAHSLAGRTPILLYGDSFAQCVTPPYECFQSILERSDLADRYCLLNYGVGGYGLDQIYLLLKHSIDKYAALDPIVIVAVLVESDLDRSVLSFRCWPKPRFEIVGDSISAEPVITDPAEWLERNPVQLNSYLWRYLIWKRIPGWERQQEALRGDHHLVGPKRLINFAILKEIRRELESRHLRHFVLLFHMEGWALARDANCEWQEPLLYDACKLLSMPIVDTRPSFSVASRALNGVSKLYGQGSPLHGHMNALGNRVAFEAIRQGVAGDFNASDVSRLESWIASFAGSEVELDGRPMKMMGRTAQVYGQGGLAWVRVDEAESSSSGDGRAPARIFMQGSSIIPTELRFELDSGAQRFSATAALIEPADSSCTGEEVEIDVRVEGVSVYRRKLRRGEAQAPIDVDLTAHQSLAILASTPGSPSSCAWLCLTTPRID